MTVLLRAQHVYKRYGKRSEHPVLSDISISISRGQRVAIIGNSGSGKSTLLRILLGLQAISSGCVTFCGDPLYKSDGSCWYKSSAYKRLRAQSGLVLQNPSFSLDPRWSVRRIISEPLCNGGLYDTHEVSDILLKVLEQVGLSASLLSSLPNELSGGQAQRVAIARAIIRNPSILVADEPMSALDVNARIQVLDTLKNLRVEQPDMALVVVSHDLGVVQHIADYIIVLHNGVIIEEGNTEQILHNPQNSFTKSLVHAAQL